MVDQKEAKSVGSKFQRILWLVDPFEEEDELVRKTAQVLKAFNHDLSAQIEPVYVMNPGQFQVLPSVWPDWHQACQPQVDQALAERLKKIAVPGLLPHRVLIESGSFQRELVNQVLSYAEKSGSQLLVLPTHARKGVPRWFLGSFAETLILRSTLPVLTVNPGANAPGERVARILFPSSIEDASQGDFEQSLGFCKQKGAQLLLFSKYPVVELPGGRFTPPAHYRAYLESEAGMIRERAERWRAKGQEAAVDVRFIFDKSPGDLAQAITSTSVQEEVDLIWMSTSATPKSTLLMGSVARQVVRSAECPVLVLPGR